MSMQKQTFATVASPAATGDEPSIVISTTNIDRDRDVIVPEGGDFRPYLRNPVVGFQHMFHDVHVFHDVAVKQAARPARGDRDTPGHLGG